MDYHQPVLASETIGLLSPSPGKIYLDATLGHGGHTLKLLEAGATVYGLDADPESLRIAKNRIPKNLKFYPILGNFKDIKQIFEQEINQPLDGIIFDLGLNIGQLKLLNRGFSFNDNSPLDMRLNQSDPTPSAADLINQLPQKELQLLFSKYVQQPYSQEICQTIINHRHQQKITTAKDLSNLIKDFYDRKKIPSHHHPATLIFLGLRIAVNDEFNSLIQTLNGCLSISQSKTIVAVISFHSGEDRIIKNFIRDHHLTLNPIIKPTVTEINRNPLSRSAVLRWFYLKNDFPRH